MNGQTQLDCHELDFFIFASNGDELLDYLKQVHHKAIRFEYRRQRYKMLEKLMTALDQRGWRLRLRGRQIEVLRRGQEEPRADAEFGD